MPTSDRTSDRTRDLRRRMVAVARRATAADGLSGFTIEDLCAEVGVSRRTFFNHFASKEDVVLGIEIGTDDAIIEAFADGSLASDAPDALAAVIDVASEHIRHTDIDREHEGMLRRALEREPALLLRFLAATDEQLVHVADAIRRREHRSAEDPMPRLVADLAVVLIRSAADRFLRDPDSPPLHDLVHEYLALTRAATAPTSTPSMETA